MKETEFDNLVIYTLRIELLNGKVLLFPIDTENKQKLINRFRESAEGDITNDRLKFICFETPSNRMVIVNTDSIVQVTFCFDYAAGVINPYAYRDNFDVVLKDTRVEEKTTKEGEIQLHGEESFIALDQIIAMELDKNLILGEGEEEEEEDDDNEN